MATYRVSPQFIFVFIAAAIVLAFFIHRYQTATEGGQAQLSSEAPVSKEKELIEELPRDWIKAEASQEK